MQGYSILKNVFDFIIKTGLTRQVYHSVEILEESGKRFPVYSKQGSEELYYIGVDDTKVMNVYCRQTDDLKVIKEERISSSVVNYICRIPHRIVFFNDFERRNQDELLKTFLGFVFLPNVSMTRVIVDREKLLQLESQAKGFNLGESSFYCAIDFDINLKLTQNNCVQEIGCSQLCNPYKIN